MNFVDTLKEELSHVFTENGDKAYATSGSHCLDFFSLCGGQRHQYIDALHLFLKAYLENKLLAIKTLFYLRDIRGGLGERNTFRFIFNSLCNLYPGIAKQLLEFIPYYGRFDDLFVCINTPVQHDMIQFIKKQLDEDLANLETKDISLLSKWMPSINTSSKETRALAKKLAFLLGYRPEEYRKLLSKLRKGRVLEVQLSAKDYTFHYDKLPSQALFKYQRAFIRNDYDRYSDFINQAVECNHRINTSTLFPYQVIAQLIDPDVDLKTQKVMDATWKSFERKAIDSKTIVVLDGSGSMYRENSASSIAIATSLAILFSERLIGPFKDTFITFSHSPQLVQLNGSTIYDKVQEALAYNEVANTDIRKVFDLLIDTANNSKLSPDEMIERVVIISDMEFDSGVDGVSSFEYFKDKFKACGFAFPEIVYWNVDVRNVHLPVTLNEKNVKLVSGASKNTIDMVTENKAFDPYNFMISVLDKYSFNTLKLL